MAESSAIEKLDHWIEEMDNQIYVLQTNYLGATANSGNIIKGWQNYAGARVNRVYAQQKRVPLQNSQRLFSLASYTTQDQSRPDDPTAGGAGNGGLFNIKRVKKKKNYAKIGSGSKNYDRDEGSISGSGEDNYEQQVRKKKGLKGIKKHRIIKK